MLELQLIRPHFLWLLIPAIVCIIYLYQAKQKRHAWQSVVDPQLLPHLLIDNQQHGRRWMIGLLALLWLIAIIALSGPSLREHTIPLYRAQSAKVMVLDLSSLMKAQDLAPSRMTRAKYKVMDMLKQRQEGQTAMVAFTREPYVVSPLTNDAQTIAALIEELEPEMMPVQGSDIAQALQKADELIRDGGQTSGEIILVTANSAVAKDLDVAKRLAAKGTKTSVLAVATEQGAPVPTAQGFLQDANQQVIVHRLDADSLQQLARAGQGRYVAFSHGQTDIENLLADDVDQQLVMAQEQQQIHRRQDDGRYLVWLLLPFALLAFRRGWLQGAST